MIVVDSPEISTAEAHTDEVTVRHSSWVIRAPEKYGNLVSY